MKTLGFLSVFIYCSLLACVSKKDRPGCDVASIERRVGITKVAIRKSLDHMTNCKIINDTLICFDVKSKAFVLQGIGKDRFALQLPIHNYQAGQYSYEAGKIFYPAYGGNYGLVIDLTGHIDTVLKDRTDMFYVTSIEARPDTLLMLCMNGLYIFRQNGDTALLLKSSANDSIPVGEVQYKIQDKTLIVAKETSLDTMGNYVCIIEHYDWPTLKFRDRTEIKGQLNRWAAKSSLELSNDMVYIFCTDKVTSWDLTTNTKPWSIDINEISDFVTDGKNLYLSCLGRVICLRLKDGRVMWDYSVPNPFQIFRMSDFLIVESGKSFDLVNCKDGKGERINTDCTLNVFDGRYLEQSGALYEMSAQN